MKGIFFVNCTNSNVPYCKVWHLNIERTMQNHNLKIRPSENAPWGHRLFPSYFFNDNVMWSMGASMEGGKGKQNSFRHFFRRSNVLHLAFQCGGAKFNAGALSSFFSHFQQELLALLQPSLRRRTQGHVLWLEWHFKACFRKYVWKKPWHTTSRKRGLIDVFPWLKTFIAVF